jgi:hypothetical protein
MALEDDIRRAREVYLAIHNAGGQIDRDMLSRVLGGMDDRLMRDALALCSRMAAEPSVQGRAPEVVGFDPAVNLYVIAKTPEQADRVIAYQFSYIKTGLERVQAMSRARANRWGQPPQPNATQQTLLEEPGSWVMG